VHLVRCETETGCKFIEGDELRCRRREDHETSVGRRRASGIRVATVIVYVLSPTADGSIGGTSTKTTPTDYEV
jgi:hypothetical protein